MDKQNSEILSYQSAKPAERACLRSFFWLFAIGLLLGSMVVADRWGLQLSGRHNPALWFFMNPSEHWKGYLGIILRQYQVAAGIPCFLILAGELIRQFRQQTDPLISRKTMRAQATLWAIAVALWMYQTLIPRLDL